MVLFAFTLLHVAISLVGIGTGLVVAAGWVRGRALEGWTRWFLVTTVLTSVTGFLFPVHKFMPSHAVGIVSLIVLAVAIFARDRAGLSGRWRATYVLTAMAGLYFNVFVLVVQSFLKIPAVKALAPTQTETPFKAVQGVVLLAFVVWGGLAVLGFRNRERKSEVGALAGV